MVATILPPELRSVLLRTEVERLTADPSFRAILPRQTVSPTYRVDHTILDDHVVVKRSQKGERGARSVVAQDRASHNMAFFMASMDFPWADEWIASGRLPGELPQAPNASAMAGINPTRMANLMLERIEQDADSFFYEGDATLGIDGMLDLDGSPLASAGTLDTAAGVKDFIKDVGTARKEAKRKFIRGSPVLAIDSSLVHFLDFPYEDTGSTGITGRQILQGTNTGVAGTGGIRVVPVDAVEMQGKALLHFQSPNNAVYYSSTNSAFSFMHGGDGEDKTLVVGRHYGFGPFRDADTDGAWRTFTGL